MNHAVTGTPTQAVSAYALLIRWVVTFHLLALVAQLALAISFVGGVGGALVPHMNNAYTVVTLGILQAVLLWTVPMRMKTSFRVMAIAVVLGELSQLHFGTTLGLGVHVTTAMLIWAGTVGLSIKVWAPPFKLASAAAA